MREPLSALQQEEPLHLCLTVVRPLTPTRGGRRRACGHPCPALAQTGALVPWGRDGVRSGTFFLGREREASPSFSSPTGGGFRFPLSQAQSGEAGVAQARGRGGNLARWGRQGRAVGSPHGRDGSVLAGMAGPSPPLAASITCPLERLSLGR